MGSYYGAEDCEFVGVYLFNQWSAAVINAQLVFIETVGLLQYLMQMGKSFIEWGKILLHYSHKKDF